MGNRKLHGIVKGTDTPGRFVLWFGACGPTYVMVTDCRSLEDALEWAAEWLKDHAPGHFVSDADMQERFVEACQELDLPLDAGDRPVDESYDYSPAQELAETDLTLTESGYLPSEDWGIALENPSRGELLEWLGRLCDTHDDCRDAVKRGLWKVAYECARQQATTCKHFLVCDHYCDAFQEHSRSKAKGYSYIPLEKHSRYGKR